MQIDGHEIATINSVPALRKMFFNCIRLVTEGGSWTFNGSEYGFKHADFVKLYKFAKKEPNELIEMLNEVEDKERTITVLFGDEDDGQDEFLEMFGDI